MKLVLLKWNQKIGGVQEAAAPKKFTYEANLAMNIYSLHRMRRKEPSIAHYKTDKVNQVSIFSGFGEGGFGGTGGENYVGIPERVLSLSLDMNQNSRDYERVAVKLASRLFINQDGLQDRVNAILSVMEKSGKEKDSKALCKFLDAELDSRLMLATDDILLANRCEAQFCYHWIANLQEDLEEMTIRPASFAMADKTDYLQKLQEKEQIIQQLAQQVTALSQGPQESQSADERLQQLQEDYQSIFLKLTEQVAESTEQFNNLQESIKGLIDDLNVSLREKMEEVRRLKEENATLKMSNE
jgi:hypothetical protein